MTRARAGQTSWPALLHSAFPWIALITAPAWKRHPDWFTRGVAAAPHQDCKSGSDVVPEDLRPQPVHFALGLAVLRSPGLVQAVSLCRPVTRRTRSRAEAPSTRWVWETRRRPGESHCVTLNGAQTTFLRPLRVPFPLRPGGHPASDRKGSRSSETLSFLPSVLKL